MKSKNSLTIKEESLPNGNVEVGSPAVKVNSNHIMGRAYIAESFSFSRFAGYFMELL